ncbi:TP901 family phage tail tape measure protein [Clostridiales Family XIII bacterium PM5-7]
MGNAIKSGYQVTVGLDTTEIPNYKDEINTQLKNMSKDIKLTVKPDLAGIDTLKAAIEQLKKEQIVKLTLDESEAIASVNKISDTFTKAFTSNFSAKAFDGFAGAMKNVSTASQTVATAAEKAKTAVQQIGSVSGEQVTDTNRLTSSLKKFATALSDMGGAEGGFEALKTNAANISSIIQSLTTNEKKIDIGSGAVVKDLDKIRNNLDGISRKIKDLSKMDIDTDSIEKVATVKKSKTTKKEEAKPLGENINTGADEASKKLVSVHDTLIDISKAIEAMPTLGITKSAVDANKELGNVHNSLIGLGKTIEGMPKVQVVKASTEKQATGGGPKKSEEEAVLSVKKKQNDADAENLRIQAEAKAQANEEARIYTEKLTIAKELNAEYTKSIKAEIGKSEINNVEELKAIREITEANKKKYNDYLNITQLNKEDLDVLQKKVSTAEEEVRTAQQLAEAKRKDSLNKDYSNANKTLLGLEDSLVRKRKTLEGTDKFDSDEYAKQIVELNEIVDLRNRIKELQDTGGEPSVSEVEELKKRTEALKRYEEGLTKVTNVRNIDAKEQSKLTSISQAITKDLNENGKAIKKIEPLYQRYITLQNQIFNQTISGDAAREELAKIRMEAEKAGITTNTLLGRLKQLYNNRGASIIASKAVLLLGRAFRDVYRNVVDVDTAMTELRKVTNATSQEYNAFLDGAGDRAQKLGATLKDVVSSSADFARLGYNIPQASALSDTALVYLNVGDEVESIDDATKSIISTMQGFGIEAENSMSIVDKFNQVGNEFATTSGGIGEGMLRSAAALHAANNSLDESIALFTAGQEVVQNAESMGTVLKTTSMRIRGAKTDLEEAGEDTDGMATSVSKLRDELVALTGGFDIMKNGGQEFKSTYEILKGISDSWEKMTDVSQANVLELLAGKRNANALAAIIKNFDQAEKVLATSQNSAGKQNCLNVQKCA